MAPRRRHVQDRQARPGHARDGGARRDADGAGHRRRTGAARVVAAQAGAFAIDVLPGAAVVVDDGAAGAARTVRVVALVDVHRSAVLAVVAGDGGQPGAAADRRPAGAWAARCSASRVVRASGEPAGLRSGCCCATSRICSTPRAVRRLAVAAVGPRGTARSPTCWCAPRCTSSSPPERNCRRPPASVFVARRCCARRGAAARLSGGVPARARGRAGPRRDRRAGPADRRTDAELRAPTRWRTTSPGRSRWPPTRTARS